MFSEADLSPFFTKWESTLSQCGIQLTPAQLALIGRLYQELAQANEHTNLTRLDRPDQFLFALLLDGLVLSKRLPPNTCWVDIGSGAGFPTFPMAILRPDIRFVAVEAITKKTAFIEQTAKRLGCDNITVMNERCEVLGQNPAYREQFDGVTARALTAMNRLIEYALPLLKPTGQFIALKGPSVITQNILENECFLAQNALGLLHGKIDDISPLFPEALFQDNPLPCELVPTYCVTLNKTAPTPPEYPRSTQAIQKRPL